MPVSALVLAAGKGERFGAQVPKPLVRLARRPLILYSLDCFDRHPRIREIIVAVNEANHAGIERIVRRRRYKTPVHLVRGGPRRQDSVRRGLEVLGTKATVVVVHDAARPLVTGEMITAVITHAQRSGAAITGVRVKATIKKVEGRRWKVEGGKLKTERSRSREGVCFVRETLERDALIEVQTPQAFRTSLLREAYRRFGRHNVTDDASLVERMGEAVRVVEGAYSNIKVTTPEDLATAEVLRKGLRARRDGLTYV